jgi:hypothetical protein
MAWPLETLVSTFKICPATTFSSFCLPPGLLYGYHNVTNQFKHIGQPEDTDNFVGL